MSAIWTFLVYMAGNNSLSGAASSDLRELQAVGSTDAVKVAVFIKQSHKPALRMLLGKGGQDEVETLAPDTDSGAPQTVVDFARWAIQRAPAQRYALVLWNHGGGWTPDDFDQLYQDVRGGKRDRRESNRLSSRSLSRAVFRGTLEKVLHLDTPEERAICSDDVTGHSLDTIEVERILGAVTSEIQQPLELLGMDACLMSTLEVAYQIKSSARVVVGSEELEPGAGWRYDAVLNALAANPDLDGPGLGQVAVQTYVDSYRNQPSQWPVTQCALATAQTEAFARSLDGLVTALRRALPASWSEVLKAQARATTFDFEMADLGSFCRALQATASDPRVRDGAQRVLQALARGSYVLAEGHLGSKVDDCSGVSLYFPSPTSSRVSRYYKDLAFAKKHRWDGFLADYVRAVKS